MRRDRPGKGKKNDTPGGRFASPAGKKNRSKPAKKSGPRSLKTQKETPEAETPEGSKSRRPRTPGKTVIIPNRPPRRERPENRGPGEGRRSTRFSREEGGERQERFPRNEKPERRSYGESRFPRNERGERNDRPPRREGNYSPRYNKSEGSSPERRYPRREEGEERASGPYRRTQGGFSRPPRGEKKPKGKKGFGKSRHTAPPPLPAASRTEPMRLNRFIANAGVCSRRDADALITQGLIKVNGEVVTNLGVRVNPAADRVEYNGTLLTVQKMVYLLMNKGKNLITTTEDEKGRRTVMDVVRTYTRERVYPVGRLDRNSTGLLLFTNDGELAEKLTHPSQGVKKVYHLRLDKPFRPEDMDRLRKGFELEDGFIAPDKADYLIDKGDDEIGIELHSGRNRIVRRMMEHLGYHVESLDRVSFGPLTKKDLPRGHCRFLNDQEAGYLKML